LVGYRKLESDSEVPSDYSLLKEKQDDPYPITVFGLSKPLSSNKIGKYLNPEFYHYLNIYKNIKKFGLPFKGTWLDNPTWILTLINLFDDINEEYDRYKNIKGLI
jgi:hypothetical protein